MNQTAKEEAASEGNGALPFEQAMDRLERLVASMEAGEVPLDELVRRFEDGAKLVHICREHLDQAELKIEKLKTNLKGMDFVPLDSDLEDEGISNA